MNFSYKQFTYFSGLIICLSTFPIANSFASYDGFKLIYDLEDEIDDLFPTIPENLFNTMAPTNTLRITGSKRPNHFRSDIADNHMYQQPPTKRIRLSPTPIQAPHQTPLTRSQMSIAPTLSLSALPSQKNLRTAPALPQILLAESQICMALPPLPIPPPPSNMEQSLYQSTPQVRQMSMHLPQLPFENSQASMQTQRISRLQAKSRRIREELIDTEGDLKHVNSQWFQEEIKLRLQSIQQPTAKRISRRDEIRRAEIDAMGKDLLQSGSRTKTVLQREGEDEEQWHSRLEIIIKSRDRRARETDAQKAERLRKKRERYANLPPEQKAERRRKQHEYDLNDRPKLTDAQKAERLRKKRERKAKSQMNVDYVDPLYMPMTKIHQTRSRLKNGYQ